MSAPNDSQIQARVSSQFQEFKLAHRNNKKFLQHHLQTLAKVQASLNSTVEGFWPTMQLVAEILTEQLSQLQTRAQLCRQSKRLSAAAAKFKSSDSKKGIKQLVLKLVGEREEQLARVQARKGLIQSYFQSQSSLKSRKTLRLKGESFAELKEACLHEIRQQDARFASGDDYSVLMYEYSLFHKRILEKVRHLGHQLTKNIKETTNTQLTSCRTLQEFLAQLGDISFKEEIENCKNELRIDTLIGSETRQFIKGVIEGGQGPLDQPEFQSFVKLDHWHKFMDDLSVLPQTVFIKQFEVQYDKGFFWTWQNGYLLLTVNSLALLIAQDHSLVKVYRKGITIETVNKRTLSFEEKVKGTLFQRKQVIQLKFLSQEQSEELLLRMRP